MKQQRRIVIRTILAVAVVLPALRLLIGETPPNDPVAWAQVSSCGNAILEPGEACEPPGSLTCPSAPCNLDCTCPPLDHFQCYEVKPSQFVNLSVTVEDQFRTAVEEVRFAHRLCPPTNKNNGGITDPTDHLVSHRVKAPKFTLIANQTTVDQFGTLRLDVKRPDHLMVPTAKDGVPQQPPLDHFQCYKVKRAKGAPKFVKRTVSIANQFETTTVELQKPVRLCAPANKNGGDPTAPTHPDHLLCYKTRGSKFGQETHTITNQFGTRSALVIRRQELCVPALKNPGTTTTTTTSTTTTTTTTTSTTTTTTSTTTTSTTTSTTTTTVYSSPSRAFLEQVPSLLD